MRWGSGSGEVCYVEVENWRGSWKVLESAGGEGELNFTMEVLREREKGIFRELSGGEGIQWQGERLRMGQPMASRAF